MAESVPLPPGTRAPAQVPVAAAKATRPEACVDDNGLGRQSTGEGEGKDKGAGEERGNSLGLLGAAALFAQLDRDHDGTLSKEEVVAALEGLMLPAGAEVLEDIFHRADTDEDSRIDLREFVAYALTREEELRDMYASMDLDSSGGLSRDELRHALDEKLHISATDSQIAGLVRRMSRANVDTEVRFQDFRNFLLLLPDSSLRHIFDKWAKSASVDLGLGEDFSVPDEIEGGKPAYLVNFVSGGVAGAVSRSFTAPIDRVKVLMQVRATSSTSIPEVMRQIFAEGGVVAFWRGNGSNCLKIAPENATKFMMYEYLKHAVAKDVNDIKVTERFLAGAGAGIASQTLIYPLEIAKTRMAVSAKGEYRGIFHCLNRTLRYEGLRGLYRGILPALAGVAPYAGTDLMVFMTLKERWLQAHPHETDGPGAMKLLLFGATSSTLGATVAYPLSLVRTRMQAQGMNLHTPVQYTGAVDCIRKTIAQDGFQGLYRGLAPNLVKTLPAVATSYLIYEQMTRLLTN